MPLNDTIRARCVFHMLQRLEAADVSEFPFPHFEVTNLFPDDVYARMMELLPDESSYQLMEKYNRASTETRFRMSMEEDHLATLPDAQAQLWRVIRDAIGDPAVKQAVFRKLSSGISFRFGIPRDSAAEAPGFPLPELYRELTGYSIAPHPDTRRKVVTFQIALPSDESQSAMGTEFYRRSVSPTTLLRPPRGFSIVKRAPFVPNSAYAFVVLNTISKKSWHGRSELPENSGPRNTLLNLYYEDPADASESLLHKYDTGKDTSRRAA